MEDIKLQALADEIQTRQRAVELQAERIRQEQEPGRKMQLFELKNEMLASLHEAEAEFYKYHREQIAAMEEHRANQFFIVPPSMTRK